MERREEELETSFKHFRKYLEGRGFTLSVDAEKRLRGYVMEEKRKEIILTKLMKGEKTSEDLTEGFSKLSELSLKEARSEGRTDVTSQDVDAAIKQALILCVVFPICIPKT